MKAWTSSEHAMNDIISLKQISFSYGHQRVLEDVSFDVAEGDFLGMIGPNGGGKTTLLRLILGLIKPESGTISVLGKSPRHVRESIGYVSQYTEVDRRFPLTVYDVVAMGVFHTRSVFPRFTNKQHEQIAHVIADVQIEHLADKKFGELSGGERQRCLIARALASHARILLLDEPTSSVDSSVEHDIYELLKKLNDTMTIVLVSHDLGFITAYVNKVVCVNRQAVIHATEEISVQDVIRDIYLGNTTMIRHQCKL